MNERDENSVNELSEYNSLPNETEIYDNNEYIGVNELFVENGTKRDAVIKLKKNNELKRFVYISKDNNVNLSNITSGEYMVYFSLGVDWDEEKNLFQENVSYSKFKDPLVFKGTLTEYTKYEITLHPVVGGQAGTEDINEEEFKLIEEGVESI